MTRTSLRPIGATASICFSALLTAGLCHSAAQAEILQTYDVGSGVNTSTIQVDFSNGNGYLFTLHYSHTLTGLGALQLMASQVQDFTLTTETFPWGELVTGLGAGTDYEYGTGDLWPIQNYWHYWIQDESDSWIWAPQGATDRILTNGSADAWVFGTDISPQAVPAAPGALLLATVLRRRQRSRSQ
jgi:hypothetical protein